MRLVNFTLLIIRTINADADEQNRAVLLVDLMRQRRSKDPAVDTITFFDFSQATSERNVLEEVAQGVSLEVVAQGVSLAPPKEKVEEERQEQLPPQQDDDVRGRAREGVLGEGGREGEGGLGWWREGGRGRAGLVEEEGERGRVGEGGRERREGGGGQSIRRWRL